MTKKPKSVRAFVCILNEKSRLLNAPNLDSNQLKDYQEVEIIPVEEVETMKKLIKLAIKYFRHVQNWSTHGPASICSEELADNLEKAYDSLTKDEV